MVNYKKYAELRDKKGVSDYRVAKESGVSATSISAWKRGDYVPKIDKIQKIADYLEVPVTAFLQ